MKLEECNLKIFDITKFCLSDYKENKERLSDISKFIDPLIKFLDKKTFKNSRVSSKSTNEIYCYDIKKYGDDFLIVLWNSYIGNNNKVLSIPQNGNVGDKNTVSHTKVGKNRIPGIPAYYYVATKERKLITLDFKGASSETAILMQYIKDFMHNFSSFSDHILGENGKFSGGYKVKKSDKNYCYFSLEFKRYINASVEKDLILNFKNVIKIITKEKITVSSGSSQSLLNLKPIIKLFTTQSDKTSIDSTVRMQVDVAFDSSTQLKDYLATIKGTYDIGNVSFVIQRERKQEIVNLDNSQAKEKVVFETPASRVDEIITWPYDASDIIKALNFDNRIDNFIKLSCSGKNVDEQNNDDSTIEILNAQA
ncbi:UNVERIFIED_ORG: hypothetical protein J2W64_001852 [Rahnella aquatilis]|uniref:hypothetical protein n=1 Tax=Rahnella sp. 2050 TaxID=3156425 RepID=UPI001B6AF50B|nr:hypothetical protein [Rahnella aquatilis]